MSDSIISLNGDILAKNGRILKSINGGGGASYTAGPGIDITNNTVSVKYDTDGLLTTDNGLNQNYYDVLYKTGKYFIQTESFSNWGDAESNLVEGRTYTVRLSARHQSDYQQGNGYAVTEDSTTLTWSPGMVFMWPNDGHIDLNWNYEDGASESDWAYMNIGGCQLQLTDDVTGDVYYTGDFDAGQISAYGEEGVLKVLIAKGNNDGDILRWDPWNGKWKAEGLNIYDYGTVQNIWDYWNGGSSYVTATSNSFIIAPDFDNDQRWTRNIQLQGYAHCNEFQLYSQFVLKGSINATANADTTITMILGRSNDSTVNYTLMIPTRQYVHIYPLDLDNPTNLYTSFNFTTDDMMIPEDCSLDRDSDPLYVKSITIDIAGLQSGGTPLDFTDTFEDKIVARITQHHYYE